MRQKYANLFFKSYHYKTTLVPQSYKKKSFLIKLINTLSCLGQNQGSYGSLGPQGEAMMGFGRDVSHSDEASNTSDPSSEPESTHCGFGKRPP